MFGKNKKEKEKVIKFYSSDKYTEEVTLRPVPASQMIPQAYKDMLSYFPDNKLRIFKNLQTNATAKRCAPMLDSVTSGYIFKLYADVLVSNDGEYKNITWKVQGKNPADAHMTQQTYGMNRTPHSTEQAFKWNNWWIVKTPPGWSTLFIHPVAYDNLPFHSISAVVDTDVYEEEIAFPFWLDKDFEGIIEKGTPIIQAIPFKRASWVSEFDILKEDEHFLTKEKNSLSILKNNYNKSVRQSKSYR